MKRKVLCLLLPLALLIGLAGCGGTQSRRTITTRECFTDELISIQHRVRSYPIEDGTAFKKATSLEALSEEIAPQALEVGYEATRFDGGILLRKESEATVAYLMIAELPSDFEFFNMRASLGGYDKSFLFPYHLMAKESWLDQNGSLVSDFREGALYETAASPEEFYDFYKSINRYELEQTADGFRINGYSGAAGEVTPMLKLARPVLFHFMHAGQYDYFYLTLG